MKTYMETKVKLVQTCKTTANYPAVIQVNETRHQIGKQ